MKAPIVLFVLVAVGIVIGLTHAARGPDYTEAQIATARRLVATADRGGILTHRACDRGTAQIAVVAWAALNATEKQTLTLSLAAVCDADGHADAIDLIDAQSGKMLAKAVAGQFTVY